MARKEYDEVIRAIALATHLDFHYVEQMLRALARDVAKEEAKKEVKNQSGYQLFPGEQIR
jgi:RNA 3'-terminal phosphate cyclase